MNKKYFCLLIPFLVLAVSCSHNSSSDSSGSYGTLREQADFQFKETVWTEELEKDRLKQNISFVKTIEKNIKLTPAVFIASSHSKELKTVYPYLKGFGSLDTSNFDGSVKIVTASFCNQLLEGKIADKTFDEKDVFEASLFMKDLKDKWEKVFLKPFPDENTTVAEVENKDSEKETEKLFDSWFTGEPFDLNSFYEVPVRFVKKNGHVDVNIYFFKNKGEWKINQLKIVAMEADNGTN